MTDTAALPASEPQAEKTETEIKKRAVEQISKDDPWGLLSHGVDSMRSVTAEIWFDGECEKAVEFYKNAFNAKQNGEMYKADNGRVMHCMVEIGDVGFMMADVGFMMADDGFEWGDGEVHAPKGGVTTSFWVYTSDVDKLYKHCLECGMTSKTAPKDMFWGDRVAHVKDPFGHCWDLAMPLKKDGTDSEVSKKQKTDEKTEAS